ncbi:RHS repeat-associated core domain-containing protein [Dysgonomonas sp. 521]|uniref:RHS repeat domain-containing protein n=1 Tax=Dysgonomonas sp. 521 TaxID=2302932 RepID=UPI0013D48F5D|nr:RHS repeat-associated core domain-containing protein [Dysgonomonas sp. 521]
MQKNHYYPFGTTFASTSVAEQGKQPYKYNGKEFDMMHGLNLYDYGARQYESGIGRFTSVDPHAENYYSWSPYAYVMNNPLKYIDPTGMWTVVSSGHTTTTDPKEIEMALNTLKARSNSKGEGTDDNLEEKEIINGLGPNSGTTKKDYELIETRKKLGYDNDMIHIYAHASEMGFTYIGKDGNSIRVRSQGDLIKFLKQKSLIWQTRKSNERIYVIIHGCGIGNGNSINQSWLQLISEGLEKVTIGGPTKNMKIGIYDEEILEKGEWVFYENGEFIHAKPGIGSNNPVWIKHERKKK